MTVTMQDVLLAHAQYGRQITTIKYRRIFDGLPNAISGYCTAVLSKLVYHDAD